MKASDPQTQSHLTAQEAIKNSQQWANAVRRDAIAATLLDPNLMCFHSVATDEPESVVRSKLMEQMASGYKPSPIRELQSFLPTLITNVK
ncbi:hypothetical protein GPJ56_004666 [Histomonas meleagridis]|uniref:uncharacterized protein n=1 Tax=Histomonas meleagridis TaxID=135588 RepID=UPI003559A957|nr:hypothetical protein GPJ56_004666 [Histomonas meleagridis]KAH0797427.1 hypothetical protein GO595_009748 [Histomonas meleagridis]